MVEKGHLKEWRKQGRGGGGGRGGGQESKKNEGCTKGPEKVPA